MDQNLYIDYNDFFVLKNYLILDFINILKNYVILDFVNI